MRIRRTKKGKLAGAVGAWRLPRNAEVTVVRLAAREKLLVLSWVGRPQVPGGALCQRQATEIADAASKTTLVVQATLGSHLALSTER